MILRQIEADVLERLRVGMTTAQAARDMNISRGSAVSYVARLSELSAVQAIGNGRYKVLLDAYDVTDQDTNGKVRSARMTVYIPEGYEEYIRGHYQVIPRKELARRLGVDKVTLNMMILQLGLGGQ